MVFQQPTENPIRHRFTGVEAIEIAKWQINFKEKFVLNYLYSVMHDWAVQEGWAPRDETKFPETLFIHKESPFGKEMRFRWRLSKTPTYDKSGLFTYLMDLDFYMLGIKDAEIVWKGQKIKGNKGEFELIVKGILVVDKGKKWEKGIFKEFKNVFLNRTIRSKMEDHMITVYQESYRLRDFVMRYLKMQPTRMGHEGGEYHLKRTLE